MPSDDTRQLTAYQQKLLDPRWQKKRLEILSRDAWACKHCGDTELTLHVHHLWYEKGKSPWEYPDTCFLTLCSECHNDETNDRKEMEELLLYTLRRKEWLSSALHELACYIYYMEWASGNKDDRDDQLSAIGWLLKSPVMMKTLTEGYIEWKEVRHQNWLVHHANEVQP